MHSCQRFGVKNVPHLGHRCFRGLPCTNSKSEGRSIAINSADSLNCWQWPEWRGNSPQNVSPLKSLAFSILEFLGLSAGAVNVHLLALSLAPNIQEGRQNNQLTNKCLSWRSPPPLSTSSQVEVNLVSRWQATMMLNLCGYQNGSCCTWTLFFLWQSSRFLTPFQPLNWSYPGQLWVP